MTATAIAARTAPSPELESAASLRELERAIEEACQRIAPLWPLTHFVAVNPFLGFTGVPFAEACATLRRVTGARMLMPRRFYREALGDVRDDRSRAKTPTASIATVADVLDALAGGDRHASRTAFMVDEISRWCAAYFDQGATTWKMPSREDGPYAAWRATMRFDRNAEAFGIASFRATLATLPDDPREAIAGIVDALGIPPYALVDYLHRALFDIAGWAGHLRYLAWNEALQGRRDERIVDLLAIRLAWGYALFRDCQDPVFREAWAKSVACAAPAPPRGGAGRDPEFELDLALQEAYEAVTQRWLVSRIDSRAGAGTMPASRKEVQAVFCIDVRSEVFRRALESVSPDIDTLGFAGFFGLPIEFVPFGRVHGDARCPVLLKPAITVCASVAGASAGEAGSLARRHSLRQHLARAWKSFKLSAVSCFGFVETSGLLYAGSILRDALGWHRAPSRDGVDAATQARLAPSLEPATIGGRATGMAPEQRVAAAEALLRAMSMTGGFARLVLLAGHGSNTVNNPYGSGLDCGACGGHTGEANARVAAAVLNDAFVREQLSLRGIAIPADTWFLAGLHDTTTDAVRLFDTDAAPAALAPELKRLRAHLARSGAIARAERALRLGIAAGAGVDAAVAARSRDWSQVRPEWGLAGNAAFIAAPRERMRALDLGGRAFLHGYDWRRDADFSVLEGILTAPMIVASWINLQYYGSTVDNRAFGAGNKVLHNVVAGIGVLEGNAGDLKVGLPWQSVHDGQRFVHEPVRLNVFVAAPIEAINAVIARHASVRELVDNQWLHLFAIDDSGRVSRRYRGGLAWSVLE